MGAFQSKVWTEVTSSGSPGSPSESKPLSDNERPKYVPFRDPRSVSDDVERTPIQIAAEKRLKKIAAMNEDSKENVMPALDQTPTGPSLVGRFKAASIDPRSPGGQDLPRTPIVFKNQDDNEKTQKEKERKGCVENEEKTKKPKRGTATFVHKLVESTEIEELLESASQLKIESNTEKENLHSLSDSLLKEAKNDDQTLNPSSAAASEDAAAFVSSEIVNDKHKLGTSILLSDSDDSSIETPSNAEDILSPSNNRCGKKTMFPMVIGFHEAKSPRSPLGQVNLNPKFMASPVSFDSTKLQAAVDCGGDALNKLQDDKPKRIPFDKEMMDNFTEQENDNDENRSLVI